MFLNAIFIAGGAIPGNHAAATGGMQIELWQAINLIGAPLLAMLFVRPVIDDLTAWFASLKKD